MIWFLPGQWSGHERPKFLADAMRLAVIKIHLIRDVVGEICVGKSNASSLKDDGEF
jgi:hypothetical protein